MLSEASIHADLGFKAEPAIHQEDRTVGDHCIELCASLVSNGLLL